MSSSFRKLPAKARRIIYCAALAVAPLTTTAAQAKPEASVEIETNMLVSNNAFLIPGEDRITGAAEVIVRPQVDWDLDPKTRLDFSAEAGFRQYHRLYGNFLTGLGDLNIRHRRNEYLTLSARALYSRDLVSNSLGDSTDFAVDSRSMRESLDLRGSVMWSPNARTTITGDGGWRKLRYPGSALLETTNAHDFGLSASRRMDERTSGGIRLHATSSRTVSGSESSVRALNLTAARQFGTRWQGDAQIGIEWSKLGGAVLGQRESRARFNGGASLCYEADRSSACLRGALRSEVSGLGGLQREVSVGATYRNRLSEYGQLIATADYRRARMPGYDATARVISMSANYEQRVGRNLYLTPGIAYLQRNRLAGEKADAVIFRIGLTIKGDRR